MAPLRHKVYPRVGGGNFVLQGHPGIELGLSPRGRGKLRPEAGRPSPARSIPAWAGETGPLLIARRIASVYPRVGGGNLGKSALAGRRRGLSPRGRGKLLDAGLGDGQAGSIPAWAGETPQLHRRRVTQSVYPRVGGGNGGGQGYFQSPQRSIPAWAGETWPALTSPFTAWVYPRVGGGNHYRIQEDVRAGGLSPRGRGKLGKEYGRNDGRRSIPAWAGETAGRPLLILTLPVYPRVGGGNPHRRLCRPERNGLSPRGRGKRGCGTGFRRPPGSIPAWAGETAASRR